MSNRAFGVEIECYAPEGDNYEENGVDYSYDLLSRNGFQPWANLVTSDESLSYEAYGVEIKSPVLVGQEGYDEIYRVMNLLNRNNYDVDSECGFHVHLNAPEVDGNKRLIKKVVKAWMRNQHLVNNMVAEHRLSNDDYCKQWSERDLEHLEEYLRDYEQADGTLRGAINVGCLSYHGTVEIRQHEGTLNPEEAVSWVKFCQAFLDTVTGSTVQRISSEELLLKRLKVEKNASRFLSTKARINKEWRKV